MSDDLQQLQRKIEEGLEAVRELRRLEAERKKRERPKLRLIKGGLIWGAIWAGVEWLCGYRRTIAALAVSGLTVGGFVAEQPHSPNGDPPESVPPPASIRPTAPPKPNATPAPRPPRTSPLRTLARNSTPVTVPSSPASRPRPAPSTSVTPKPSTAPNQTPAESAVPSLTPLPTRAVETPELAAPAVTCVVNLLGVELCLERGGS